VIKGLMRPISEENVNLVNAAYVAQGRGWHIDERLRDSHNVFHNLIHLTLTTSHSEVSVAGSVRHGGQPNIVVLNGLDVDLVPEAGSYLLICDNDDRPGMIGRLGTLLGSYDINISAMQVGRTQRRGRALMILALDEGPDEAQQAEIAAIDGIYNVRIVRL
jgi:D-3-phosphoglycerate dehydrogenase